MSIEKVKKSISKQILKKMVRKFVIRFGSREIIISSRIWDKSICGGNPALFSLVSVDNVVVRPLDFCADEPYEIPNYFTVSTF